MPTCTQCNRVQDDSEFMSERFEGVVTKTCATCRKKDSEHKKRNREKRNAAQREKKYYKTYRDRKRKEDEEGFLRRNAATMKAWRDDNKEHLTHWKNTNVNYNLKAIQDQARKKGIPWAAEFTKDNALAMMAKACYYCGLLDPNRVNGIDRMDNNKGYSPTNAVPCCKFCNFVKKALDAHTFVERCLHIDACQRGDNSSPYIKDGIWHVAHGCAYDAYKRRAIAKDMEFKLTLEEFEALRVKPCNYCHQRPKKAHGVDRVNNQKGYIASNCVPCCSECNCMKSDMSVENFMGVCSRVAQNYHNLSIPSMPRTFRCMQRRDI